MLTLPRTAPSCRNVITPKATLVAFNPEKPAHFPTPRSAAIFDHGDTFLNPKPHLQIDRSYTGTCNRVFLVTCWRADVAAFPTRRRSAKLASHCLPSVQLLAASTPGG